MFGHNPPEILVDKENLYSPIDWAVDAKWELLNEYGTALKTSFWLICSLADHYGDPVCVEDRDLSTNNHLVVVKLWKVHLLKSIDFIIFDVANHRQQPPLPAGKGKHIFYIVNSGCQGNNNRSVCNWVLKYKEYAKNADSWRYL